MVGGLVEQQQGGLDKEGARERHAHAPPAGHVLGCARHHLVGEAQPVKQLRRPALRRASDVVSRRKRCRIKTQAM
eukprot:977554-Pyramimonas_sp.AAC.1